jgi:hypothetical protein
MAEKTTSGAAAPETNVCGAAVPRVVHQIWLQGLPGGEPAELIARAAAAAGAARWEHRLWSHASMLELPVYRRLQGGCRTYAHFSNVGRFALLHEYGGLYLDADVELWRLPDALVGAWAWTCDAGGRLTNPCCLAAPPRHPYLDRCLAVSALPGVWRLDYAKNGVALAGRCLGPDVRLWPRGAWSGAPGAFGVHGSRCARWGSARLYGS